MTIIINKEIFLSTPSARRATLLICSDFCIIHISIHALREEGDAWSCQRLAASYHFYPRPPRGGRPPIVDVRAIKPEFLSTPSARRATLRRSCCRSAVPISIHALREEGDLRRRAADVAHNISIHALREEGDTHPPAPPAAQGDFYPRPPRGGRQQKQREKHPAFVSLYTSLHKLQRDVCKPNRKITPLLAQTAGIPVRSVPENHVCCRFALAGHQKISTLSWANSGCSPTCSTLVW